MTALGEQYQFHWMVQGGQHGNEPCGCTGDRIVGKNLGFENSREV